MAFERLVDILRRVGKEYPASAARLQEAEAIGRWESAVGPMIAKHARILKVDAGTVWVQVDHPIWHTELHHRKRQILDKLNEKLALGATAKSAPAKNTAAPVAVSTDTVQDPAASGPNSTGPIKDIYFVSARGRA